MEVLENKIQIFTHYLFETIVLKWKAVSHAAIVNQNGHDYFPRTLFVSVSEE